MYFAIFSSDTTIGIEKTAPSFLLSSLNIIFVWFGPGKFSMMRLYEQSFYFVMIFGVDWKFSYEGNTGANEFEKKKIVNIVK